jgi:tetratricopeptide (TPR) repeat protein
MKVPRKMMMLIRLSILYYIAEMKLSCALQWHQSWRSLPLSRNREQFIHAMRLDSQPQAKASGSGGSTDDLSDAEFEELLEVALGDDYKRELNAKVAAAMQEDWDITQGVTTSRAKPLPLKANVDLWSYNARGHLKKGDFALAEKIYQQCVEYDPCDGRGWMGLARIYWKKGQALQAEKAYKDGLYYSPNNPFLLQGWATMLEKLGKIPTAMNLLKRSVKSNPKHAASWVSLAQLHQRSGKVEEARYCYSSAVEGDPKSYVALQAWGVHEVRHL